MSGTTILNCGCGAVSPTAAQSFQDRRYGKGRRVCNINEKEQAHCTCCGQSHRIGRDDAKGKKKSNGGGAGGGAKQFVAIPPAEGWPGGVPDRNGWRP